MNKNNEVQIECCSCGDTWTVNSGPLFWKAKKAFESGEFPEEIYPIVNCGCRPEVKIPDNPYRVSGFRYTGEPYFVGFDSFVKAIIFFREANRFGMPVLIGVSKKVLKRIS